MTDKRDTYKMSRYDQFHHPLWDKFKYEQFILDEYTCKCCGTHIDKLTCGLTCHHIRYPSRDLMLWDSPHEDVTTMCWNCHDKLTSLKDGVGEHLHDPKVMDAVRALIRCLTYKKTDDATTALCEIAGKVFAAPREILLNWSNGHEDQRNQASA